MARKVRSYFLYVVFSIFSCAYLYHHYLHRHAVSPPTVSPADAGFGYRSDLPLFLPPSSTVPITNTIISTSTSASCNQAVQENLTHQNTPPEVLILPPGKPPPPSSFPNTLSVLLPNWEVVVIVSPDDTPGFVSSDSGINNNTNDGAGYHCLFPNSDVSPATFSGVLPFPDRATFKCILPERIRRKMPFPEPLLTRTPADPQPRDSPAPTEVRLLRNVVYDSLTTDVGDVVVFVKGLNNRQGSNREPSKFNCLFYAGDDVVNGVRTPVTSSMQEVFRCQRPEPESLLGKDINRIKVTLVETTAQQDSRVVPTVAYYSPEPRKLAAAGKALLCACTMVYNVAKFLKEWVMYHSELGVQRFVLYDNGSDDNLHEVVADLVRLGYDVVIYFWFWPKTQEAGFSHSAVYAKESCSWMAYIDVDEFIYSARWNASAAPSRSMLQSLLSTPDDRDRAAEKGQPMPGQVYIECREFGPSNRTEHPEEGVTQGYNCRKRKENRHKSIVLVEAIDASLLNFIHHFKLKPGFNGRKINVAKVVVNHYKFQAWPEFKAKFRRRVSAYVVDWTLQQNLGSNDRTPGLGYTAVEPEGWPQKFCEVRDDGLKQLTLKWFAGGDNKMAWQR